MKNKFIKTLIIINGILIPLVILTVLTIFIYEYYQTKMYDPVEFNDKTKTEYTIKFTTPQEIVNSTNHYIAVYKKMEVVNELLGMPIEERIGEIPENTVNIIFLDKNFKKIGSLLDKNASIKDMFIPNIFSKNQEEIKKTKFITYSIAIEDTNQDKITDYQDNHYLYISDLDGMNLRRVIDKRIKGYKLINDLKEIMVTYYENNNELSVGIYKIEEGIFEKRIDINEKTLYNKS